ncbi:MAG TPA: response regulator [Tepidisphaeraceae bacterium]|nr:response regulator [Tepidisphaeraceae bacterium]
MARLLVVDDDASSLEATCKYLETVGHTVECVPNGREALERILHKVPDLVILDLFMPQLDGCSLLEIMRSYLRLQSLPVVVLTGITEGPMIDRARNLKVSAILVKGKATLEEIAEAVKTEMHRIPN